MLLGSRAEREVGQSQCRVAGRWVELWQWDEGNTEDLMETRPTISTRAYLKMENTPHLWPFPPSKMMVFPVAIGGYYPWAMDLPWEPPVRRNKTISERWNRKLQPFKSCSAARSTGSLSGAFDDVSTMSNPGLINLGLKSGVRLPVIICCRNGTALNDQLRSVIEYLSIWGWRMLTSWGLILFTSSKFPRWFRPHQQILAKFGLKHRPLANLPANVMQNDQPFWCSYPKSGGQTTPENRYNYSPCKKSRSSVRSYHRSDDFPDLCNMSGLMRQIPLLLMVMSCHTFVEGHLSPKMSAMPKLWDSYPVSIPGSHLVP